MYKVVQDVTTSANPVGTLENSSSWQEVPLVDETRTYNEGEIIQDNPIVDQSYKDKMAGSAFNFASAHLSRYLLEGEPKVEFSAGGTN